MIRPTPHSTFRAFLYGSASVLLLADIFFLIRAVLLGNFIPIIPLLAGIAITGGLLFIVYAEQRAREEDRRDHRRISRVAHQLEMPLKGLQDDFRLLQAQAKDLPAETRLALKRMDTKTQTLLENIRDVFLMLQAQEGTISQEQRVYDLCVLVNEVAERVRPMATARNVELVQQHRCENAPVKIDRHLFFIALTHLIENGIVYTKTPGWVNIVVKRDEKMVRVIVQDRGIGITQEEYPMIWQPFARGVHAEQFDSYGIGVGLTLSRFIVREWGGKLLYKPRPTSMGSQFEIQLPLAATT